MSLPYFPMYPTDFEAKTSHLTLLEDGVYNRLLRLCWMTPGCSIPADEAWIMRRLRARTDEEQEAVRSVLDEFFTVNKGRYSNARLSRVFSEANESHAKRKTAGAKGGAAKSLKTNKTGSSNAKAKPKQPEPEPEPELSIGGGGDARAREAAPDPDPPAPPVPSRPAPPGDDPTEREQILAAIGADPISGMFGPNGKCLGNMADMQEARRWRDDLGLTVEEIIQTIREVMAKKRDSPPSTFRYFSGAMQRFAGSKSRPTLTPIDGGTHERTHDAAGNGWSPSTPTGRANANLIAGFARAVSDEP